MNRKIFDIETNGLDDASVVHTIVIRDPDTGVTCSFADQPGYRPIREALDDLQEADVLIGHNILTYDLPVLRKLYPGFDPKGLVRDTLILARLIWTDLSNEDFRRRDRGAQFPSTLIGSHSLKAWGYRLGVLKGVFAEQTDWKQWSKAMQDYCEQDVQVTDCLWKVICKQDYSEVAIQLEHDFAWVIFLQEKHGFRFNEAEAGQLAAQLLARREQITAELQAVVAPKRIELKTPEYYQYVGPFDNRPICATTKTELKKLLKVEGFKSFEQFIKPGPNKFKLIAFNPGSRLQVAAFLRTQGWVPEKFTDSGQDQIDESALDHIDTPAAKLLKEFFIVSKLVGQISVGDNAWLKLAKQGRIHGRVNTNGAVTGRCAHFKPNVSQVPSVLIGKDKHPLIGYAGRYGWECRSLFMADEHQILVGADASGLELRCLAHYMARYDDGAYGKVLLEGDVHTVNQHAAGIATRAEAKTFIYSYLYGAGNYKIGLNCGGVKEDQIEQYKAHVREWAEELKSFQRKRKKNADFKFTELDIAIAVKGNLTRKKFEKQTPALAKMKEAIREAIRSRGFLVGIDGRKLHVRSEHSALNTLLQSCGAILVKMATVILYKKLIAAGWRFGVEWAQVAHIHDEIQASVMASAADTYGRLAVQSIQEAGELFKFRIKLDGEYKIGPTWAATH